MVAPPILPDCIEQEEAKDVPKRHSEKLAAALELLGYTALTSLLAHAGVSMACRT
jgi:hypothetical protein